jgi:hypothetical protein
LVSVANRASSQNSSVTLVAALPGGSLEKATTSIVTAFPILNEGTVAAESVSVTAIRLSGAALKPRKLPMMLGTIAAKGRATVFATFDAKSIRPGNTFPMEVQGTFMEAGRRRSFRLTSQVQIPPAAPGSALARTIVVPGEDTSGGPFPFRPPNFPNLPKETNESKAPALPVGTFHPLMRTANETTLEPAPAPMADPPPLQVFANDPIGINNGDPTNEPSGGANRMTVGRNVIFVTFNRSAAFSVDGGVTFTELKPTTVFKDNPDGGFCCDQVVQYIPSIDRFVWVLQYFGPNPSDPSKGPNRERIAAASPATIISSGGMTWKHWDITTAVLGAGDSLLDYPDLAVGNSSLYLSFDDVGNGGLIVLRIPLSEIQAGGNINAMATNTGDGRVPYLGHLTQNPGDQAFWAGHNSNSNMRVFAWPEGSNQYTWTDIDIGTWPNDSNRVFSLTPDAQDWLSKLGTDISFPISGSARVFGDVGGTRTNQLYFAWTGSSGNGFAQPQVQWVALDISNHFSLVTQRQLFSNRFAMAYPALASNSDGEVGVSAETGGGGQFENHGIGFLGDNKLFNTTSSTLGVPRFGDFVTIRRNVTDTERFDAFGYGMLLGGNSDTRLITFGRGAIPPNTLSFAEFTISTGGDDLRGDSAATAVFFPPNSTTPFQTIALKSHGEPAWDNNTTKVLSFPLSSPVLASALGSIDVILVESDPSCGVSCDNWDIKDIRIKLYNTLAGAPAPACVLNLSGNPVVRLTASGPTVTFNLNLTKC